MSNETTGRTVMVQGRLVWTAGDLFKGYKMIDRTTKQAILDKAGNQKVQYGFGLAVPKSVLGQVGPGQPGEVWNAMYQEAFSLYPNANGQLPPKFAMKFKDGDKDVDESGQPYAKREGYAGHIVLSCVTYMPLKFYRWENNSNIQINEGIKCGDYVNVQLQIKAHPPINNGSPGLYLNPLAVQFLGYGKAIVNTPSGDDVFGKAAPMVPQGASATPIAPVGMIVPQGAPAYNTAPAPYQPPQAAAPAPQPHYGVLPPQHQPQPAAPAPYPPQYGQAPAPAPMPAGIPMPPVMQ